MGRKDSDDRSAKYPIWVCWYDTLWGDSDAIYAITVLIDATRVDPIAEMGERARREK
jgi:hypothetical protein